MRAIPLLHSSNSSDDNPKLTLKLSKMIAQNDRMIFKEYLKKSSMSKPKTKNLVLKTVDRGLLVERTHNKHPHLSSITSNLLIPMLVIGDTIFYYKLPAGKKLGESIRRKLAEEINREYRGHKEYRTNREYPMVHNVHNYKIFSDMKGRLKSSDETTEHDDLMKRSSFHIVNMSTLSHAAKTEDNTKKSESTRRLTNETDLMSMSFHKRPSEVTALSKYPGFQTFLHQEINKMNPELQKVITPTSEFSLKSTSMLRPTSVVFEKIPFSDAKNIKHKISSPIIPNYVYVDELATTDNIMNNEDNNDLLSLVYTERKIRDALKLFTRSFSGNLFFPYRGPVLKHRTYCGNFGFVDGINYLRGARHLSNESYNRVAYLATHQNLSRESFMALSHMFNLHKLVGKSSSPLINSLVNKRSVSFDSFTCSVFENIRNEVMDSDSDESVDFRLVSRFTEKLIQDFNREENDQKESASTLGALDDFEYETMKVSRNRDYVMVEVFDPHERTVSRFTTEISTSSNSISDVSLKSFKFRADSIESIIIIKRKKPNKPEI